MVHDTYNWNNWSLNCVHHQKAENKGSQEDYETEKGKSSKVEETAKAAKPKRRQHGGKQRKISLYWFL